MTLTTRTLGALAGLLALLGSTPARAEGLVLTVQPESDQVQVGASFQVVCQVSASGDIDELELPDLGGLTQLGQSRNEGSQVSIVNGQMTVARSLTVALSLVAETPGRYVIGPGTVRSGGQSATSQPVTIVATASGSPATPPRRPAQRQPDPGRNGRFEKLFAALSVDRGEVYLGEQVAATLYIYSRVDLSDIRNVRLPAFEGLVVHELDSPRRVSGRKVMLDGRRYQAYMLRRLALFPTRAGLLKLPPASVAVVVGGGFFGRGKVVQLATEPVEVQVKPLPVEGRPPGFEPGNVGDYALEVEVSTRRITATDPLTLKVSVVGSGNLRTVRAPMLRSAEGFRIYQPTPYEESRAKNGKLVGRKGYEVLLQPQRSGTLTLPQLRFAFFDPRARRYHVASSDPIPVIVTGSTGPESAARQAAASAPATSLRARPVRLAPTLNPATAELSSGAFTTANAVLVALIVVLLLGDRLRRRHRASSAAQRRQLREQARREVLEHVQQGRTDRLAQAVERYLEQLLQAPVQGLTRDGLQNLLNARQLPPALAAAVLAFGDAAEARRFAPPGQRGNGDLAKLGQQLVEQLERELPPGAEVAT